jgi:hypothetical protein
MLACVGIFVGRSQNSVTHRVFIPVDQQAVLQWIQEHVSYYMAVLECHRAELTKKF